jgi:hypothetical protein
MRRWLEGLETFAIDVTGYDFGTRPVSQIGFDSHLQCFMGNLITSLSRSVSPFTTTAIFDRALSVASSLAGKLQQAGRKTPVVEMLARLSAGGRVAILPHKRPRPLLPRVWDGIFKGGCLCASACLGWKFLLWTREPGDEPFMLANNPRASSSW